MFERIKAGFSAIKQHLSSASSTLRKLANKEVRIHQALADSLEHELNGVARLEEEIEGINQLHGEQGQELAQLLEKETATIKDLERHEQEMNIRLKRAAQCAQQVMQARYRALDEVINTFGDILAQMQNAIKNAQEKNDQHAIGEYKAMHDLLKEEFEKINMSVITVKENLYAEQERLDRAFATLDTTLSADLAAEHKKALIDILKRDIKLETTNLQDSRTFMRNLNRLKKKTIQLITHTKTDTHVKENIDDFLNNLIAFTEEYHHLEKAIRDGSYRDFHELADELKLVAEYYADLNKKMADLERARRLAKDPKQQGIMARHILALKGLQSATKKGVVTAGNTVAGSHAYAAKAKAPGTIQSRVSNLFRATALLLIAVYSGVPQMVAAIGNDVHGTKTTQVTVLPSTQERKHAEELLFAFGNRLEQNMPRFQYDKAELKTNKNDFVRNVAQTIGKVDQKKFSLAIKIRGGASPDCAPGKEESNLKLAETRGEQAVSILKSIIQEQRWSNISVELDTPAGEVGKLPENVSLAEARLAAAKSHADYLQAKLSAPNEREQKIEAALDSMRSPQITVVLSDKNSIAPLVVKTFKNNNAFYMPFIAPLPVPPELPPPENHPMYPKEKTVRTVIKVARNGELKTAESHFVDFNLNYENYTKNAFKTMWKRLAFSSARKTAFQAFERAFKQATGMKKASIDAWSPKRHPGAVWFALNEAYNLLPKEVREKELEILNRELGNAAVRVENDMFLLLDHTTNRTYVLQFE